MSLALDSARLSVDEGLARALANPIGSGGLRAIAVVRAETGDFLAGAGVEVEHRFLERLGAYAKAYAGLKPGGHELGAVAGLEYRW